MSALNILIQTFLFLFVPRWFLGFYRHAIETLKAILFVIALNATQWIFKIYWVEFRNKTLFGQLLPKKTIAQETG